MQITLLDEGTLDPLPAGTRVALYPLGEAFTVADLVAQATIGAGGTISVPLAANLSYVALFAGVFAPTLPQTFATPAGGADFSLVVTGYRSPNLSTAGYVALQRDILWPKRWIGSAVPTTPVAHALASMFAGPLAVLDTQAQTIRAAERLESCRGLQIDAWVRDHVGAWLARYVGESDALYVARTQAVLAIPRLTVGWIQRVVNAFIASTAGLPTAPLAFDSAGSLDVGGGTDVLPIATVTTAPAGATLSFDAGGAMDSLGGTDAPAPPTRTPVVTVFDIQTQASNAAALAMSAGMVGVLFSYPGYSLALKRIPVPSLQLDAMIQLGRVAGFPVVYAANNVA